jgi:hypothetical protein
LAQRIANSESPIGSEYLKAPYHAFPHTHTYLWCCPVSMVWISWLRGPDDILPSSGSESKSLGDTIGGLESVLIVRMDRNDCRDVRRVDEHGENAYDWWANCKTRITMANVNVVDRAVIIAAIVKGLRPVLMLFSNASPDSDTDVSNVCYADWVFVWSTSHHIFILWPNSQKSNSRNQMYVDKIRSRVATGRLKYYVTSFVTSWCLWQQVDRALHLAQDSDTNDALVPRVYRADITFRTLTSTTVPYVQLWDSHA